MRHIHVELAHKKATLDLPAQEGDLPPPTAPAQGLDAGLTPGAPRHFGQEELRLQKVYQLSIFSQLGGFSTSTESLAETQKPVRLGVKRGLDEPQLTTHKRPYLGDSSDQEALEGEVLCGPAPPQANGMGVGVAAGPGGPRDSDVGVSPRSPPLSPSHNPPRRPLQHNHDRPVPDAFAPLSPKPSPSHSPSSATCDPHAQPGHHQPGSSVVRAEAANGSHPAVAVGSESCGNGVQPNPCSYEMPGYETPNPASPTSPPGPFSPPHHTELQEPGEATQWEAGLESSPPERSATQAASSNGLASWEKTPTANGHRLHSGGHWPAKKRLLSPSDTGESCSEDEGPSTSKRSRLSLLAAGLGPASCRSTDAKAAPYWNHLLPSTRDQPKVSASHTPPADTHTHTSSSIVVFLWSRIYMLACFPNIIVEIRILPW